jgi:hypothetical protein
MQANVAGGGTIYWDPNNEGCYFSLTIGDTGAYTLDFTSPSGEKSGQVFRFDFYQGHASGGATLAWPAGFKFQTAGDALVNPNYQFLTAWEGLIWAGNNATILMTKLGEWDLS